MCWSRPAFAVALDCAATRAGTASPDGNRPGSARAACAMTGTGQAPHSHAQPARRGDTPGGGATGVGCALKLPGGSGGASAEALAGGNAELGEHVAQVPLDGAGADKQLGGDLLVGVPVSGQPGDLGLLG